MTCNHIFSRQKSNCIRRWFRWWWLKTNWFLYFYEEWNVLWCCCFRNFKWMRCDIQERWRKGCQWTHKLRMSCHCRKVLMWKLFKKRLDILLSVVYRWNISVVYIWDIQLLQSVVTHFIVNKTRKYRRIVYKYIFKWRICLLYLSYGFHSALK